MENMPNRDDVAALILRTSAILAITRTVQILTVPLFVQNRFTNVFMTDDFHHYHLGFAVLVLMIVLYRYTQKYIAWMLALCLAWLIEEHLIIIEQLGGKIPWYYLSMSDTIIIYLLALSGVAVSLALGAKGLSIRR